MSKFINLFSPEGKSLIEQFAKRARDAQTLNIMADGEETLYFGGKVDHRYSLVQPNQSIAIASLMAEETEQFFL